MSGKNEIKLLQCAAKGDSAGVKSCIKKGGVDINCTDEQQRTPLHLLVKVCTRVIMPCHTHPPHFESSSTKSYPPPYSSCHCAWHWFVVFAGKCLLQSGKEKIIPFLLEFKANVRAQDSNKNTPLHYAAQYGFDVICDELCRKLTPGT
jgi:hypothetical protein